ncbi:MAG TPA: hypothetical protein VIF14_04550 [Alphaproteobacteria bacterium]|jgi:hypothetical protein
MMRVEGRLHSLALGAAVPLWAALASLGEASFNPLHALSGRWEARDPAARDTADCRANSDEYRISGDGRHVELLLHRGGKTRRERFVVMHVANDRVLLFVEGEPGRNEYGGPIVWWAVFDGRNRFRWHRDDWPRNSLSAIEWRRCW